MSSRKESLKKSLGITEYPWSSDDDLDEPNTSTAPDVSAFRHSDPRPPTDIPGPSGLQPSQVAPATWRQAKYDRDLFWSILNSPCNPVKSGTPPYSSPILRQVREDATIPGRLMHAPAADHTRSTRGSNVPDVQRILAFKRLTRNINSLRNRNAPSSSSGSRGNSGPGLLSSELAGLRAANHRHQMTMRRFQPTRSVLSVYRNGSSIGPPSNFPPDEEPMALTMRGSHSSHGSGRSPSAAGAGAGPSSALDLPRVASPHSPSRIQPNININHEHEDDNPGPSTSQSILADEVNLIQDEPSDLEISVNNTSGMTLEEEIVEIDADEAPSPTFSPTQPPAPPAAPIDLDGEEQPRDPNLSTTSSRGGDPSNQQMKQGVKRKRQDSDDNSEPYTVKEYNQELLRLLECPVCLEWMEPPMSQCRRGHLVCGRCRTRLNACPVCRTTFSSVRNRAMEGVAEMVRYPCRHGCGREVRLRRRAPHEASCEQRKYQCPAPACVQSAHLPRHLLADHFQSKHLPILKIGNRHKFSIKMSTEQHDNWLILAMDEYFHLRIDVDIRVFVYVSYIGPKCDANNFIYEVTVEGQHHSRKLVYARSTHCDLESPTVNVSREDCFSVSLDQALNFIRFKNRRCDADKYLDFNVEITKIEPVKEESDS